MVLVGHEGEDLLAYPGIGHQVGVLTGQLEVDVGEGLFGFVDDESKEAKVAEHPLEECLAARSSDLEECPHARPHAEPAGNEVPILRPGEYPGDCPQIGERAHAGPPRGPGPDVQERDLLHRARGLEVGHEMRVLDEPPVGRVRGTRQRFHRFVELGGGDERLLPLGLERVLEHARREQLRLVGGGAPVCVLE